jgi:hypothetical protein
MKALCSYLDTEEEVTTHNNLHPWAPNPSTISVLAVCRLGQLASSENFSLEDENGIIANGLDKIVGF